MRAICEWANGNPPSTIVNIDYKQRRFVRAIPWDDLQGEKSFGRSSSTA